jgi:hypothetical protein
MKAELEQFKNDIRTYDRDQLFSLCVELKEFCIRQSVFLKEYENSFPVMTKDYQNLKEKLKQKTEELSAFQKKYQYVCEQNLLLTKNRFGTHNERIGSLEEFDLSDLQDPLSEEQVPVEENQPDAGHNPDPKSPGKGTPDSDHRQALIRKTLRKLKKLLNGEEVKQKRDTSRLPHTNTYLFDPDELDGEYGKDNWEFAGWHRKEFLHRLPCAYYVEVRHVPVIKNRTTHTLTALPMPGVMLSHSPVTESLLASIYYEKFYLSIPLYRVSKDMENQGLVLSRQTLSNWVLRFAETHLGIIYDYLIDTLKGYSYHQCDESTLEVIHDGRKAGSKSYLWVHSNSFLDPVNPIVIFCFEKTRGTDHLRNFYQGLSLILTSDAYGSYFLLEKESGGKIRVTGCFMHCRRRFWDALQIRLSSVKDERELEELPEYQAIRFISEIYRKENPLRDLSPEERLERRQKEVKPEVDAFFEFVHQFSLEDPLVSEKMKDAINYARNQESYLRRFLEDGHVPVDNGYAERNIHCEYTIGRRNWLFCNTERGAEVTAMVYSIVETACQNGANPLLYLQFLLEKTPDYMELTDRNRLEELMPWSGQWHEYEKKKIQERLEMGIPVSQEKPHYRLHRDVHPVSGKANIGNDQAAG